jgi:transaldolase
MDEIKFLKWLSSETNSNWWHDSADPDELKVSIENGAVGVTTNPLLIKLSLFSRPEIWNSVLSSVPKDLKGAEKAEAILGKITTSLAGILMPTYNRTHGDQGYVCAQVNPAKPGNAELMIAMARRLTKWSPNIAVKLPVTAAGLEALEECAAEGITVTLTASFTVPQALAIGEGYKKGVERAKKAGIKPAKCFAVLMIGRLDDYLRDVAMDRRSGIAEEDIIQAGIAVAKRAYSIFNERKYEAIIMPAGMRGTYHMTELAGAKMIFSTAPSIQKMVSKLEGPFHERINLPVNPSVINRLMKLSEFVRAYEPDGMKPEDFITYGVTQKTLSQFVEAGWLPLEGYKLV